MSIDQSDGLSRSEDTIALACWIAFHLLRPRPRESDPLFGMLPWRADADHFDEGAGPLFLKEPTEYDDVSPETLEKFEQLGPGALDNAARYCFFELSTNPLLADTESLLDTLAGEFQHGDRLLPEGQGRAFSFGRFAIGPLGVIERTNSSNGFSRFHSSDSTASLQAYAETIQSHDHDGMSCNPNELFDLECIGWSARWTDWMLGERFVVIGEDPDRYPAFLHFRHRWHPADNGAYANRDLRDWEITAAPQAIVDVKRFEDLKQILNLCLDVNREAFFKDVEWSRAPLGKTLLATRNFGDLDVASLCQLLMAAPPRLVVSCLNDVVPRIVRPLEGKCFAVNLAQILIEAYRKIDNLQRLEVLTAKTGGDFFDRVLHYILRRDPETVLRQQLDHPDVAAAIAALTCCSYKYHGVDWDFSDPDEAETLASQAKSALGFVHPKEMVAPNVAERALPLDLTNAPEDAESARNMVNQGRRRAEWILKTAIQYAYALNKFHDPDEETVTFVWPRHFAVFCPREFYCDESFRDRVAANVKDSTGQPLQIPTNGKMTLQSLMNLINALESVLEHTESEVVRTVMSEQKRLCATLQQLNIASLGNLGSHDNPSSLSELLLAREILMEFDSIARNESRALPTFMAYREKQCIPNRPTVIHFEVVTDMIPNAADDIRCEHYFTTEYEFLADRLYSVTDVTSNAISLNPIVLDWTDWLTK